MMKIGETLDIPIDHLVDSKALLSKKQNECHCKSILNKINNNNNNNNNNSVKEILLYNIHPF